MHQLLRDFGRREITHREAGVESFALSLNDLGDTVAEKDRSCRTGRRRVDATSRERS